MIDSHTHLFLCEKPIAEVLEAAAAAGVTRMLNVGLDEETNDGVVAVTETEEAVFAAVGRHPNDATGFDEEAQAALAELGAHPNVRAIGETGLDFYRDTAAPDRWPNRPPLPGRTHAEASLLPCRQHIGDEQLWRPLFTRPSELRFQCLFGAAEIRGAAPNTGSAKSATSFPKVLRE